MNSPETPEPKQPNLKQDIIEPTAFKPTSAEKVRRPLIRPVTVVVGIILTVALITLGYIFTARSVAVVTVPAATNVSIVGGLAVKVGDRYLLRAGQYRVRAEAKGYHPLEETLEVTGAQNQSYDYAFTKLPGLIDIRTEPVEAEVHLDGVSIGKTPIAGASIVAGSHRLEITAPRYFPYQETIDIEGREVRQSRTVQLTPAWSKVSLSSEPAQAEVLVDSENRGKTPVVLEVLEGKHELRVTLPDYKAVSQKFEVVANQPLQLPVIKLEPADGSLRVTTQPEKVNLSVSGTFHGQTPLTLSLPPGKEHRIELFKSGYQKIVRKVTLRSGVDEALNLKLKPILADIRVSAIPKGAQVYVEGVHKGAANQTLRLPTQTQRLEVRKPGYVTHKQAVTPRAGLAQHVKVTLRTLEQAKWDNVARAITTTAGQRLKLFRPNETFVMGASRREAGRRANEMLREVTLNRPFYLGVKEVTNGEYRQYNKQHSSGHVQGNSLNGDEQPVVNVSWAQAALYCNWLSEEEGLPVAYEIQDGKIVSFDAKSTGYRLSTEAEWAWAARTGNQALLKYPWGRVLPPPDKSGNYADRTAAFIIGRTIEKYDDSYAVSAPVGVFPVNRRGLYDIGGNVAEWVNDFYGTASLLSRSTQENPLGPTKGELYVIRGASWAHGTVTELRLSFRDFGRDPRNDVGFRVARYVE